MKVNDTPLSGLKLIQPKVFADPRGFFFEGFQDQRYLEAADIHEPIVQINFSRSSKNVLRGLHYQLDKPQGKLVTVTRGSVLDVVVDIRRDSPTFGQHLSFELNDENHLQAYIPKGFAHGFLVLSDEADFCYACTDYYDPAAERGVLWSDPALAIQWNIQNPILSEKDKIYPLLKDIPLSELA